jgi:hypothetical protein
MNTILTALLAVICLSFPITAAILGTRSRLQYARRIREAQARGAFADMNTPKNRSRTRRLAMFALIGILGMTLSCMALFVQMKTRYADLYGITIGIALFFGIIGAGAGLLMQRDVDRRL